MKNPTKPSISTALSAVDSHYRKMLVGRIASSSGLHESVGYVLTRPGGRLYVQLASIHEPPAASIMRRQLDHAYQFAAERISRTGGGESW